MTKARIQRLAAQVESERTRAEARAHDSASRDSATAATLRDRALDSSAAVASIEAQLTSAREQLEEVEKDLQRFETMEMENVIAETSYLDRRLRKLAIAGSVESLEGQLHWLEQKVESGITESDRLLARSGNSLEEAMAASNIAFLEAQLAEAWAELEILKGEGRHEIRVIAYPEADIVNFPVLCKVKMKGPGFEAGGFVESWFAQDKTKPGTLLLP